LWNAFGLLAFATAKDIRFYHFNRGQKICKVEFDNKNNPNLIVPSPSSSSSSSSSPSSYLNSIRRSKMISPARPSVIIHKNTS